MEFHKITVADDDFEACINDLERFDGFDVPARVALDEVVETAKTGDVCDSFSDWFKKSVYFDRIYDLLDDAVGEYTALVIHRKEL